MGERRWPNFGRWPRVLAVLAVLAVWPYAKVTYAGASGLYIAPLTPRAGLAGLAVLSAGCRRLPMLQLPFIGTLGHLGFWPKSLSCFACDSRQSLAAEGSETRAHRASPCSSPAP